MGKMIKTVPLVMNNMSANGVITRMAYNLERISDTVTELNIYDEIASKKSKSYYTGEEIGDEVTPDSFKKELDSVDTDEIVVRINSGGGEVTAANVISVAIQEARNRGRKISCKIDGMCASAAVQIALSCSPVVIHQSAYMMIHNPMAFMFGYYNSNELKESMSFLDSIKKGIMNTYTSKTGLSETKISHMMDATTYMDGKEAVNLGFADSLMFVEEEEEEEEVINRISRVAMNSIYDIPSEIKNKLKNRPKGEVKNMTREELERKYPEIINAIRTEAVNSVQIPDNKEAIKEAVNAERERMKAIDEMAGKVDAEVLNKAKYETFESAEKVAFNAIKDGKFVNVAVIEGMKNDSQATNQVNGTANGGAGDNGDTKAQEILNIEKIAKNHLDKIK